MLEDIYFGPFQIEASLVLRTTHLLNSILLNFEVSKCHAESADLQEVKKGAVEEELRVEI